VLKDSGDTPAATDALRQAIKLQPDQPSLHIQLAALETAAGDKESAASDRRIAADLSRVAVSRQRASFALKSARSLLADGKLDQAMLQLHVAIEAEPTLAEPHHLLAQALLRQHNPTAAALEEQTAVTLATPPPN
jgi:Flp pilus assembly protein TadD